ncbi:AP-2 adaptor complex subunit sigma, putative [Trichophyton verrucosum HKI 0517]|uniref:AP-2 adaptor complex subunit sigma, putative n=1 Tax=Trichophyton verrucosum (strain HKI 0517) TaxID=663202 RepID=D4DBK1_TRIVH|nr:AP-2 adaptor complex subunit sigma, putative [Trichophyton verrucosum HKI 0517]EFE40809.1 AP-2 adaptor complex subunit sigma, putative [Trichophyton verrucosum HKI 0517]
MYHAANKVRCLLDSKVVYRRYASLFFIAGCSSTDNELITLEIVHRYVEQMDKYYGNVCELDIIFNFQKAYFILDELLLAGEMQESSKKNVLRCISQQDSLEDMERPSAHLDSCSHCLLRTPSQANHHRHHAVHAPAAPASLHNSQHLHLHHRPFLDILPSLLVVPSSPGLPCCHNRVKQSLDVTGQTSSRDWGVAPIFPTSGLPSRPSRRAARSPLFLFLSLLSVAFCASLIFTAQSIVTATHLLLLCVYCRCHDSPFLLDGLVVWRSRSVCVVLAASLDNSYRCLTCFSKSNTKKKKNHHVR